MKKIKRGTFPKTAARELDLRQVRDIKARRAIDAIVGGVPQSAVARAGFRLLIEA